jgi:hypothetical protein
MHNKILKGTITNMNSGKTWPVKHYMINPNSELTSIVRILKVRHYFFPDDSHLPIEINIECEGLGSAGSVFKLHIFFRLDSFEGRDRILEDLKVDSLFQIRGGYDVTGEIITLFEPAYLVLGSEFSEDEIRKAFEINRGK